MNEGIANYVAYQALGMAGHVKLEDVKRSLINTASFSGEAITPLQDLERSSTVWPGHIGYLAIDHLAVRAPNGPTSIRTVCERVAAGSSVDQAFENAFGVTKAEFYRKGLGIVFNVAKSTSFSPTVLPLAGIGSSAVVTVKTVEVPPGADAVQLNIQHSSDVTVTSSACVGIFSGANVMGPTPVSGGTFIRCTLLSSDVSAITGDVMTFLVTRAGTGDPLLTFALAGGATQFSDAGNPISPGATTTLQITSGTTVTGTITLQGRTAIFPTGVGHSIARVMLSPGGVIVNVNADGSFEIPGVAAGTYTLTASAAGYVSRERSNVVVGSSAVTLPSVQLRCGLVDSNEFVNIHDITATVASFGKTLANRVDAQGRFVDQNGDTFVNINDITCVVSGFGKTSPEPWP
jgi:hypothetical protein